MAGSAPTPTGPGFFTLLPDADRLALSTLGRHARYRRDTTLFIEGDHSTHVVVVLSGQVRVSYVTPDGREIFLATKGAGELLGELSAIDGRPRSATVTTLGPTEVLLVEGADFMAFIQAHSEASLLLLRMVSERLRDSDRRQVEFGVLDTVERVVRQLVDLARTSGELQPASGGILIRISQQELAAWTGSSREAVNKALAALRAPGLLSTLRGGVRVHDLEALERRLTGMAAATDAPAAAAPHRPRPRHRSSRADADRSESVG
jgi:CRP/FNR family transcriptional regulator, cyclic AMP receptor protein